MYSTLFATTFVFALAALRVWADFDVPAVELTQCKSASLHWAKTDGPYNLIIVPVADPCGPALVDLGDHDTNSFQWSKVNITAGSKVLISVLDDKEQEGWSGSITVKSSDDKTCLTSNTPSKTPGHSSPSPSSKPPATTPNSPAATVVGAANSGVLPNGASTIRLSGVAVVFTALGALVALL